MQLTKNRTLGFLREPEALFWVFGFPILLAAALGIAFRTQKPQPLPVGIVPGESAAVLRTALETHPEGLEVVAFATAEEAERAMRTGKIVALIAAQGAPTTAPIPEVSISYDPSRPDGRTANLQVRDALQRAAGRTDPVTISAQPTTRRGARYIDFLLPGLIGMNLMGTGMWGIGFPIATARQQKLLKRFIATPMRRSEYLLSFLLSRIGWLILEVGLLILFGRLVFGISITGSWTAYAVVVLVGALAFSALGLLVVSRAKTIEAVSGLMNAAMLPMWLLSGTFFSSERFPRFLQPVIQALPLTAVNDALRVLTNEAGGWGAALPALGLVSIWGVVCFAAAMKLFRWE
jgi:ABC-type multidrug transport system permease subunit